MIDRQGLEWQAWQDVIEAMCKQFKLTREQINNKKYRPLFHIIETWAQEYTRLRIAQRDAGEFDVMIKDGRIL